MKTGCISKFIAPGLLFSSLWLLVYYFYPFMDAASKWSTVGGFIVFVLFAYVWCEFGILTTFSVLFSALAFLLYDQSLLSVEHIFVLKYFLSSPVALLWMTLFFCLSFLGYLLFIFYPQDIVEKFAKTMCRLAIIFGLTGMLVRWYESHLIGPDIGHIPMVSFFEVMIWLILCSAFLFLWLDDRYKLKAFGLSVMTLIVLMITGLLLDNQLNPQIQPLMPALQSAWIRLHVPTSFIGYAGFGVSAAAAVMFCLSHYSDFWAKKFPSPISLTQVMYRATGIGFLFFALGIMTGSLWAAEAWGSY
jgi:ABC-type transport system involved in cytochrome c biogenesis permease subunit